MPCESGRGPEDDLLDSLNRTTRLFCEVMAGEEARGRLPLYSAEVLAWWAEHKKIDEERKRMELEEKELRARREAAANKLTPEERRLLGIR